MHQHSDNHLNVHLPPISGTLYPFSVCLCLSLLMLTTKLSSEKCLYTRTLCHPLCLALFPTLFNSLECLALGLWLIFARCRSLFQTVFTSRLCMIGAYIPLHDSLSSLGLCEYRPVGNHSSLESAPQRRGLS